MNKELAHKDLSGWAEVKVALEDGKLIASVELPVWEKFEEAIEKAKAAIPGKIDDALWDGIKATIKGYMFPVAQAPAPALPTPEEQV